MQGIGTWIVFANKVIVFGEGEGVFLYNGTPALGNYPLAWLTSSTVDPYGNVLPGSIFGLAGENGGVVSYTSNPPALNGLAWSANNNSANITDAYGNVILPGITAYSGSVANGFSAVQLQALSDNSSPLIAFYQAADMTDWGTAIGIAGNPGSSDANFVISGESGGMWMTSTGVLYTSNPTNAGVVEVWHAMPSFSTNYSHGSPGPAYKLNVDNTVSFTGIVSVASGTAGAKFVTLPYSQYFPLSTKKFAVPISAGTPPTAANPQITIDTSGGVTFSAPPTGAAFTFALDVCRYPLDY